MKVYDFLVSIIIPYHGNRHEVKRLLNTIPDRADIEVVLVNDLHDSTPLDYPHFSLLTFRELKNQPSARWAGASRNTGLAASRGEFIVFADSDDKFIKNGLIELLEELKQAPSFSYAICRVASILESTGEPGSRYLRHESIINDFVSSNSKLSLLRHYVPWGKVYRHSFLTDNNILFEEVIASNDVLFSAKCLVLAKKIIFMDVLFYETIESTTSLSELMTKEIIHARFLETCKYNEFLRRHGYQDNQVAMSRHLYNIVRTQPFYLAYASYYSVRRGNPIFYDFAHFKRVVSKLFFRKI